MLDALKISILGVLQFAVVVGLLNLALRHTSSARAALLFSLCPALTLILEAMLRRRRPSGLQTGGVLLALSGVAIVLGWEAFAGSSQFRWLGEGCALASALVAAVCALCYRSFLGRYGALRVGIHALPAAVAVLAGLAALEGFYAVPLSLSATGWLAIAFIGCSSAIGYILWLWALKHASPTRVTVFLTLNPVAAAFFGWLFLAEPVGTAHAIGVVCVIAGICLAYCSPAATKRPAET